MKIEKMRLYLDDVRTPKNDEWVVVRNYDEFVKIIQLKGLENFEVISLDHDLGDSAMIEYYTNVKNNYTLEYNNISEKTGYDAAKFLVAESMNTNIPLPQIYVHSANPIGTMRKRTLETLTSKCSSGIIYITAFLNRSYAC